MSTAVTLSPNSTSFATSAPYIGIGECVGVDTATGAPAVVSGCVVHVGYLPPVTLLPALYFCLTRSLRSPLSSYYDLGKTRICVTLLSWWLVILDLQQP